MFHLYTPLLCVFGVLCSAYRPRSQRQSCQCQCVTLCHLKSLRQANDVEENPGPTIFDIIDPTIIVSAVTSFVISVTDLKTNILTAFENEIRVSFLLRVNPFTPKSDLIDFTLSNTRRFCPSKGDPSGVKGSKNYLP